MAYVAEERRETSAIFGSTSGIGTQETDFIGTRIPSTSFHSFSDDNYYATWIYFTFWLTALLIQMPAVKNKLEGKVLSLSLSLCNCETELIHNPKLPVSCISLSTLLVSYRVARTLQLICTCHKMSHSY